MPGESAVGICPECGAANPVTATACWMCGRTAWAVGATRSSHSAQTPATGASAGAPITSDEIWIADDQDASRPAFRDARKNRWLILGTTCLVIAGVGWEAPGLATLLAIVVGLPLLVTLGTAALREARFHRNLAARREQLASGQVPSAPMKVRPMSGGEQVGLFLKWMAVAAGSVLVTAALLVVLIAVMVISLVTALLEACGVLFHTAQGG